MTVSEFYKKFNEIPWGYSGHKPEITTDMHHPDVVYIDGLLNLQMLKLVVQYLEEANE